MSQPRLEIDDPTAYRAMLEKRVDGRDPLAIMAETADHLASIVRERGEHLTARPFEGKWTPVEILGHLVDTEWVFGARMRAIAFDDRPTLVGMDPDCWVEGHRHVDRHPAALVEEFRALRQINLAVWRSLTDAHLDRVGLHNERGEEKLRTIRMMCAGHDLHHIEQLGTYLDAAAAG